MTQVETLAERLFVAVWKPTMGIGADALAASCCEAAEIFEKVRSERFKAQAAPARRATKPSSEPEAA